MSSLDSLTAFFYNIVPGSLFVLFLGRYQVVLPFIDISSGNGFNYLIVLVYGLFFGFIFQGFTKISRNTIMNKLVFCVITSDRKRLYNEAKKLLKPVMSPIEGSQLVFYLMDNFLRANGHASFVAHFTARLAFWSNIFFGSVFLTLVLIRSQAFEYKSDFLWLIAVDIYSMWLFYEYLRILYESVLQSFVTTLKFRYKFRAGVSDK